MGAGPPISGSADTRFTGVRSVFEENLRSGRDLGAAFAATVGGELVVDFRGGFSDRAARSPWSEDTLACIYSSGKAIVALMIARAVGEGLLDFEAPVARYWPEFAAAGKDAVTVGEALSHQGGLSGFPGEMSPADWLDRDLICSRLAAMAPLWPPGSASGYHPQTFGFIAGELLRRAGGRSVGQILGDDFRSRGLQIYCGLSTDEIARAAYMPKPPRAPDLGELNEPTRAAFLKPWSAPGKISREAWAAAELPASNIHADARSLALALVPFVNDGAMPDGGAYLRGGWRSALRTRISGPDLVLPFDLTWAAGLMRNTAGHFGPSGTAYGHAGFGGSCVLFDPERRLTAAYVMNRMGPHLVGDPRALGLIDAFYAGL